MFCHCLSRNRIKSFFLFIFIILNPTTVLADYIFTAPPRENSQRGNTIYEPIAKKLSSIIGERVIYEQPTGWQDYSKKMRAGHYDIVFDGPHFAAWRIKHLSHIPIATLPGKLDFYLVAWRMDDAINTPRDLVGEKICGLTSPHLATDMIYNLYKNPVLQPQIYDVKGRMRDVYQAFKEKKCRATIFRDVAFKKLSKSEREQLKIIARTPALPNQTITISERLRKDAHKLSKFFTSREGAIVSSGILKRYSRRKKYFEAAHTTEFKGAEGILENVVWGW